VTSSVAMFEAVTRENQCTW